MATISERINKIIANQLGLVEKDIRPDSRFTEDLNADSLDMVEMTMAMEEEFSTPEHAISIPDEVAESIKTVQDAIDYIRNLGSPYKKFNAAGETVDSSKTCNPAPVKKRSFINNIFRKKRSR